MTGNAVVVDTNLIFSALIPKSSRIRDLLIESDLKCFAPNFLIYEIFKIKEKLAQNTMLEVEEIHLLFDGITERIRFVPLELVGMASKQKAYDLCKNVDEKDIPFVALSIDLNIPLWTGDKKLQTGLKSNGFDNFYKI